MQYAYKTAGALLAAAYAAHYAATTDSWHFIDNVDLVFHEAGHTLFFFFGQFMYVLMGSLFQILLPTILAGYFFFRRDVYSGSVVLFWVAINIINVSVYMGDAQRMALPLIGGHHDWNWLLSTMGVLSHTEAIARTTYSLGVATIVVAGILSCYALLSSTQKDGR